MIPNYWKDTSLAVTWRGGLSQVTRDKLVNKRKDFNSS